MVIMPSNAHFGFGRVGQHCINLVSRSTYDRFGCFGIVMMLKTRRPVKALSDHEEDVYQAQPTDAYFSLVDHQLLRRKKFTVLSVCSIYYYQASCVDTVRWHLIKIALAGLLANADIESS